MTHDRLRQRHAFQPGQPLNRLTTAQSNGANAAGGGAVVATFAAMAALRAGPRRRGETAARRGARRGGRSPREAGEPIMAIVSIKSQTGHFLQISEGWIS